MNINDIEWMKYAIILANTAKIQGEVPVGAVLIYNNQIIGSGFNRCIQNNDPTAHAEIIAIKEGGSNLKNYRLVNTTLYITLEPCMMCLGAIINSRISRLVLGTCLNYKKNNQYNTINILKKNNINIIIDYSPLSNYCINFIKDFFKKKRK